MAVVGPSYQVPYASLFFLRRHIVPARLTFIVCPYLMHTEVSVGTVKAALVGPREVFGPAVRGAASIMLCHNHPSGEPAPS